MEMATPIIVLNQHYTGQLSLKLARVMHFFVRSAQMVYGPFRPLSYLRAATSFLNRVDDESANFVRCRLVAQCGAVSIRPHSFFSEDLGPTGKSHGCHTAQVYFYCRDAALPSALYS